MLHAPKQTPKHGNGFTLNSGISEVLKDSLLLHMLFFLFSIFQSTVNKVARLPHCSYTSWGCHKPKKRHTDCNAFLSFCAFLLLVFPPLLLPCTVLLGEDPYKTTWVSLLFTSDVLLSAVFMSYLALASSSLTWVCSSVAPWGWILADLLAGLV